MKTFTKITFFLFGLFVTEFPATLSAQEDSTYFDPDDPNGGIETQLTSLVEGQFGEEYRLAFSVLDSAIKRNESTADGGELTDPYGTLKGCVLFGADRGDDHDWDHGIMGLYKDGRIIWYSQPVFKGAWGGIHSIKDINRDGKVDILVEWSPFSDIEVRYLWIISWDGHNGQIINRVDPTDSNSTLISSIKMFQLLEPDTGAALLVRGYWSDSEEDSSYFPSTQISTRPWVTYSWNGSLYGLWSSSEQIPGNEYLPARFLFVTVRCRVYSMKDSLSFQYAWTNSPASHQRMSGFALAGVRMPFVTLQSGAWYFLGWWKDKPIAGWQVQGLDRFDGSLLPGRSKTGVLIHTVGLPAIVKFYIQGYRPLPDFGINPTNYKSSFENDFYDNSFVGSTIGPVDPPSPFVPLNFLDTLASFITRSRSLGWIKDQRTADKYSGYFASAKGSLQQNNTAAARTVLQQVLQQADIDSTNNLTSEAYALIRYNTEYLLTQLPTTQPGLIVKLISSAGGRLTAGSLQYYEGGWKDAANNNDGTFAINTTARTLSLRMTYEYGTQTKSNVAVGQDTAVFQTVNAQVGLQDSKGNLIDGGAVQYYAGAWRNFGPTTNGIASKELLPNNYTFRMTYAYGSNDKQQNVGSDPTVVFRTVNVAVQLEDSHGNLMDQGTVQYYAGAWRDFGTTTNGVATKELLPNNYTFRMTYAYGSNDKQQDIAADPTVVFRTVNAAVQLRDSRENLVDQGTVQYYAGAWRPFGITTNGVATKELLPRNYPFRMTYEFVTSDKSQDISTINTVSFSTVLCTIRVTNSQNQPVDNVQASYYSGAWRQIGSTVNGQVTKELLPANLTFRITHGTNHQDKTQNLSESNLVEFIIP